MLIQKVNPKPINIFFIINNNINLILILNNLFIFLKTNYLIMLL